MKQIGPYMFSHVCTLHPLADAVGNVQSFLPQVSFTKRSDLSLHAYGAGPFCKFRIPTNLPQAGVYALSISNDVKYIGECLTLSSRFNAGYGQISPRNCYMGGQPTNCQVDNLIYLTTKEGKQVDLWFIAAPERKAVEAELLHLLQPEWNRSGVTSSVKQSSV